MVIILEFNKKQKEAILHKDGMCSVIAPAGSGKTAVLINRVLNLVNSGIEQSKILVVSFTNDTAKELNKKLSLNNLKEVHAGTFHSTSRDMLLKDGVILSPKTIITDWQIENIFNSIKTFKKAQVMEIKNYIDYQKVNMKTYKDKFVYKSCTCDEGTLRECFKAYEEYKIKNGLHDWNDWLLMCYESSKNKPCEYDYVLIDEHQDNNYLRNLLVKEWARHGNVFYVGDYRQSIYAFNGAMPEMFMNIDKDWKNSTVINLNINYRSCKNIVENSNKFIKPYYKDYTHYCDTISENKNDGNIEKYTYYLRTDEGKDIADKIEQLIKNGEDANDIAVLYRNNANSDYIENELKKKNIKYYVSENKSFFDRKETKLILAYLKLLDNPHDDENFDKLFNLRNKPIMYIKKIDYENIKRKSGNDNKSLYETFISYNFDFKNSKNVKDFEKRIEKFRLQKDNAEISLSKLIDNIVKTFEIESYIEEASDDIEEIEDRKKSIDVLKAFAKGNDIKSFLKFAIGDNKKKEINGVKLLTIHASKGLEFKNVFIISVEDGKFPSIKSDNVTEEARLFYVAITRAKQNLYISQIGQGNIFIQEYFNN